MAINRIIGQCKELYNGKIVQSAGERAGRGSDHRGGIGCDGVCIHVFRLSRLRGAHLVQRVEMQSQVRRMQCEMWCLQIQVVADRERSLAEKRSFP